MNSSMNPCPSSYAPPMPVSHACGDSSSNNQTGSRTYIPVTPNSGPAESRALHTRPTSSLPADEKWELPLYEAILKDDLDAVIKLVEDATDLNKQIGSVEPQLSALSHACNSNNPDSLKIMKLLVKKGSNVNGGTQEYTIHTPIARAAMAGNREKMEFLLQHKANPNNDNLSITGTPTFIVCERGDLECLKLLLDYGADRNFRTPYGEKTLDMIAEQHGHTEIVNFLKNYKKTDK